MRYFLLISAALAAFPLAADDVFAEYQKQADSYLQERKFDAYGRMRYLLIQRYQTQVKGSFYNNVPELREAARQEIEEIAVMESRRLRAIMEGRTATVPVPVRKKGEYPRIQGAELVQNVVWPDGKTEERPVYLFGFGAFRGMWSDLEFLGNLGINYIQAEVGPSHIYPEENRYDNTREKEFRALLSTAEKYGILMDLLISPHYLPQWFFDKNPDAKVHLGGFLRVGLNRPATQELMRQCYSKFLPQLASQPALWSISVTNEPVAFLWNKDVDTPRLWHEYLSRKYRSIADLNRKWGTEYPDFKAVEPVLTPPRVPFAFDPRLYDWTDFNAARLAGWIAGLGRTAREYLPGKPQGTKMIQRNFRQYDLMQGVDVYHFTRNGELNGFDGGTRPDIGSFMHQMVARSLLLGARKAPLINSEHHLLRDRNVEPVPAGFVRAAFFTDALTGLNGSIAWNWDWDGSNRNSPFIGLFRYRPRATEEYVRTGLDLMRLAPEVAAISGAEPEVGILYSRANLLWNQESIETLNRTFAAVSAAGIQAVVIPDQVLASGELAERFPELKVLILPDVRYLPDEAFTGLEIFMQQGFHSSRGVLAVGGIPDKTPYGKKRDTAIFDDTAVLIEQLPAADVEAAAMTRQLEKFAVKPEFRICTVDGKSPQNIFFRTAVRNGRRIAAVVNLSDSPTPELRWVDASGKPCTITDAASLVQQKAETNFRLKPWQVMLGELNSQPKGKSGASAMKQAENSPKDMTQNRSQILRK